MLADSGSGHREKLVDACFLNCKVLKNGKSGEPRKQVLMISDRFLTRFTDKIYVPKFGVHFSNILE